MIYTISTSSSVCIQCPCGGPQQEMCPVVCVFSVHCARQVCKSRARFSLSIDVGGILNSLENQKYKKSKL